VSNVNTIGPVALNALNPVVDGTALLVWQAPTAVEGGGVTITSGYITNNAATGSGTAFAVRLLKFSSAGTPVLNGTIAAAVGGTTDVFAAGVPKSFTIASGFVSAGEWVALDYDTVTGGTPTAGVVGLHYVMGRGAQ
jgi:hypothetical protein